MPSNAEACCPARRGVYRWQAGTWRLAAAAAPSLQAALDAADQA